MNYVETYIETISDVYYKKRKTFTDTHALLFYFVGVILTPIWYCLYLIKGATTRTPIDEWFHGMFGKIFEKNTGIPGWVYNLIKTADEGASYEFTVYTDRISSKPAVRKTDDIEVMMEFLNTNAYVIKYLNRPCYLEVLDLEKTVIQKINVIK